VSLPGPPMVGLRCASSPGFWSFPMIINWAFAASDPKPADSIAAAMMPTPSLVAGIVSSRYDPAAAGRAVMLTRSGMRGKASASNEQILPLAGPPRYHRLRFGLLGA
jgi:hypothetical protein